MKVSGKHTTRSNETFQSLRNSILCGAIPAGSRIRTNDLCKQFDISLGAVREALSQLLAQGLVVSEAHRGFTVSPVSAEDLLDLTRVRIELESVCLTWAIQAGNVEWESTIMASLHRLSKTSRLVGGRANLEWADAHDKFHASLLAACGSPRLLQMRQQLYEQSERYRHLELSLPINRNSDSEHQRIAEAVLARDIPAATRYIREHLNMTASNVLKSMQSQPSPRRTATTKRAGAAQSSQPNNSRPARAKRTSRSGK